MPRANGTRGCPLKHPLNQAEWNAGSGRLALTCAADLSSVIRALRLRGWWAHQRLGEGCGHRVYTGFTIQSKAWSDLR